MNANVHTIDPDSDAAWDGRQITDEQMAAIVLNDGRAITASVDDKDFYACDEEGDYVLVVFDTISCQADERTVNELDDLLDICRGIATWDKWTVYCPDEPCPE